MKPQVTGLRQRGYSKSHFCCHSMAGKLLVSHTRPVNPYSDCSVEFHCHEYWLTVSIASDDVDGAG